MSVWCSGKDLGTERCFCRFVGSRLTKAEDFTERTCDVYCLSERRGQLLCMTFRNSRSTLPAAMANPYEGQLRTDLKDLIIWDIEWEGRVTAACARPIVLKPRIHACYEIIQGR